MKGEVYVIWLVFFWFISLPIVLFYWWKKRKAKISAGENYLKDANYQKYARRKNYSDIACAGLFFITTLIGLFVHRQIGGLVVFWSICLWLGSIIAFIIFWWKKRQARLSSGENYFEDLNYQKISKYKRIIGVASVIIFIFLTQIATNPNLLLTSAEIEDLKIQVYQEREKFISGLEGEEKIFMKQNLLNIFLLEKKNLQQNF